MWGPVSDRIGRPRAIRAASLLLVAPTIGVALAPGFEALLVCRTLQGLCMPGLLAVGAPYIVEAFVPRIGARAMGYYVSALVAGGLVGRLGVALATAVVGWRVAIGLLAILPLVAAVVMRRGLPEPDLPPRGGGWKRHLDEPAPARRLVRGRRALLHLRRLVHVHHLPARGATVLALACGREPRLPALADRSARAARRTPRRSRRLAATCARHGGALGPGLLLTLPDVLPLLVLGLACIAGAMFTGYTATQLGVSDVARVDRGAATALYFGIYYAGGALGAYVPGLAWEAWGWGGVAATGFVALGLAAAGITSSRPERTLI